MTIFAVVACRCSRRARHAASLIERAELDETGRQTQLLLEAHQKCSAVPYGLDLPVIEYARSKPRDE